MTRSAPVRERMARGVKVYSSADASGGYGAAGIAYVRGLVNSGVRVHWIPLEHDGLSVVPLTGNTRAALCERADHDRTLEDLPALLAITQRPVACDAVLVHTAPEHWDRLFERGRRNVGYTTWEADMLPPHWVPCLRKADAVCVPSTQNQRVFSSEVPGLPVHVVPHIRRHVWNPVQPTALAAFRASLEIPESHFVFYSINTWDPRKNLPFLLHVFGHAFQSNDPVTLVLKTWPLGYGAPPLFPQAPTAELARETMLALNTALGRPPPGICLLPYELGGLAIDLLHELGDCYVSFSHGEGWGLGAFDAATKGNPVVMTGWGGQQDYLGREWSGAVPFRLGQAPVWPVNLPSYWPSQRWANPDFDAAVKTMRQAFTDHERMRQEAVITQHRITNDFAEPVVVQALLEVLLG